MAEHPSAPDDKKHVFDNPKNVKRAFYCLYALCVIAVGFDLFIHRHVEHPLEEVFGFYAVFGFGACAAVILGAKELRKLVMRGEDYYDG